MCGTGIGVDAQLRRRGLLAADGDVAFGQRCTAKIIITIKSS
jgi:hypothetical protein